MSRTAGKSESSGIWGLQVGAPKQSETYLSKRPTIGYNISLKPISPNTSVTNIGHVVDRRPWNRKYQFMETSMQRKAAGLKEKIPDIQKTLDTVRFLKTRTVCLHWQYLSSSTGNPSEADCELGRVGTNRDDL